MSNKKIKSTEPIVESTKEINKQPKSKFQKESYDLGRTEPFFPNFLLKEWMIGSIFVVGLLILAAVHPAPLERIADPNDATYMPMPDWYFLSFYQYLKLPFASGEYMVIGGLLLPALGFFALFLAPFLDRGPERKWIKRPISSSVMLFVLISMVYLTWVSVKTHDWDVIRKQGEIVEGSGVEIDKTLPEYKLLEQYTCTPCHGTELNGTAAGSTLINMGKTPEEIEKDIVEGIGTMAGGYMKGATTEEIKLVSKYLSELK